MNPIIRLSVRNLAWLMANLIVIAFPKGTTAAPPRDARIVDALSFGDPTSETTHATRIEPSDIVRNPLGETARRLLPLDPPSWEGGKAAFAMKTDPDRLNYVTVRLWGSDVGTSHLQLFCEGKQIGYRLLGDVDALDIGSEAPFCNGRFFYNTSPLPMEMTKGKSHIELEIRSSGRIWSYGRNWEEYQKNLTEPTRGLYRIYTHTDGAFEPPAGERQGTGGGTVPVRKSPGPEVLDEIRKRLSHEIDGRLRDKRPPGQMQMQFLAKAYFVKWTAAHQNPKVIELAIRGLDADYLEFSKDPKFAQADPSTPNPNWFGLGPSGQVISLLREPLTARLDEKIDDGAGGTITRRAAYTQMLVASRDWHRRNRRQYTNQSMINDLYGIYWANRGIAALDPASAMPEKDCRHYLYESLGMQPWLGSDTDAGPSLPEGRNFMQLTEKGLSRELGYVGYYGEVLDWSTQIYDATRPTPEQPGDPAIKDRLIKIARARAAFRYPALDADGNRAMRIETIVGWRDVHYPGGVTYAQRPSWDGSPLDTAAATLDPHLIGYVQQMFEENQFFDMMQEHMQDRGFRTLAGLLNIPDAYELLKAQPPSADRLPMSGTGDYVFADEEDGVVAIKHGEEMLYASLYWRARYAINNLARVHFITPEFDRIATVHEEEEFEPSGLTYTRPNWINYGFGGGGGGIHYPGNIQSALAGEKLPIAKMPDGIPFKPGQESLYAGRALFYTLRYGDYLIGMNASREKTFALPVPAGIAAARELVSGKLLSGKGEVKIGPMSTVVVFLGE